MIEKLENGNTLITLGEGTVFIGNVHANDDKKPFGIYFTNERGKSKDAVIIALPSDKAVASYMMAIMRFIEAHADEDMKELKTTIESLKKDLEPLMPKSKND